MSRRWGLRLCMLGVAAGLVLAGAPGMPWAPVLAQDSGAIDFNEYTTEELVALTGRLSRANAILACENALERVLTADQDAWVRYNMGRAYARMRMGVKARQRLTEILQRHCQFDHNVQVAFKLALLYHYIILPDTEQDKELAIQYYQWVVDHCDAEKVYYRQMESRLALAYLYCDKGGFETARGHCEVIYEADADSVEPLPSVSFTSQTALRKFKEIRKKDVLIIKTRIPLLLVVTCTRPTIAETIVELEKLKEEYSSDEEVVAKADKAIARLAARETPDVPDGAE